MLLVSLRLRAVARGPELPLTSAVACCLAGMHGPSCARSDAGLLVASRTQQMRAMKGRTPYTAHMPLACKDSLVLDAVEHSLVSARCTFSDRWQLFDAWRDLHLLD